MEISGAITQQVLMQQNLSLSLMKKQADAQMQLVDMIQESVDATRGQGLNISV